MLQALSFDFCFVTMDPGFFFRDDAIQEAVIFLIVPFYISRE